MKYFTAAANVLLTDFLPHYGVDAASEEMIHEAIKISHLVPDLVKVDNKNR